MPYPPDSQSNAEFIDIYVGLLSFTCGSAIGILVYMMFVVQLQQYVNNNNITTFEQLPDFLQLTIKILLAIVSTPEQIDSLCTYSRLKVKSLFISEKSIPITELPIYQEILRLNLQDLLHDTTMEIPEHLRCPISMELLLDPVFTLVGQTYERKNIRKWFSGANTDPIEGVTLTPDQKRVLISNQNIVDQAIQFLRDIAEQRARQTSAPTVQPAQPQVVNCIPGNNGRETLVHAAFRRRQRQHNDLFLAAFAHRQEQAQNNAQQPDPEIGNNTALAAPLLRI